MVTLGGGADAFVTAMQDIAGWGEVTLIVHTEDGIFETTAPLSTGRIGHGYYNLTEPKGLHGHLRHQRCAGVAFVERPFMGKSSAFVAFLNVDGGVMFKVFVGRDETRTLKVDQLEKFRALAAKIAG
jgi:putative heme utilization carrier protein HutX